MVNGAHLPTLKLETLPHIPVACNNQTHTPTTTTTFRIDLMAEAIGIYRLIRYKPTPTIIRTMTRFTKGMLLYSSESKQAISHPIPPAAMVKKKVDPAPGSDSTQIS